VTLSPQAEELFEDRVVKQAKDVECLVLDGRFVGRVCPGGPHEVQQVLEPRAVGRIASLEPFDQERLDPTHESDVDRRTRLGRVRGEYEHDVGRRQRLSARLRRPRARSPATDGCGRRSRRR